MSLVSLLGACGAQTSSDNEGAVQTATAVSGTRSDAAQEKDPRYDSVEGSQIRLIFNRCLRRDADAEGFKFWADKFSGGMSIAEIRSHICASQEAQDYRVGEVKKIYDICLGRAADEEGLKFWSGHLASGMPALTVRAYVCSSQEAQIRQAFKNCLRREPDEGGRNFYLGLARQGLSLKEIKDNICSSEEAKKVTPQAGSASVAR